MTSNKYEHHGLYCFSGFARSREKSSRGKFLESRVAWTVNADSPAVGRSDNQQKGWVGSWAWNSDGRVQRGLKGTQETGCLTPQHKEMQFHLEEIFPSVNPWNFPQIKISQIWAHNLLSLQKHKNERATGDCQLHGSFWGKLSRMFGN